MPGDSLPGDRNAGGIPDDSGQNNAVLAVSNGRGFVHHNGGIRTGFKHHRGGTDGGAIHGGIHHRLSGTGAGQLHRQLAVLVGGALCPAQLPGCGGECDVFPGKGLTVSGFQRQGVADCLLTIGQRLSTVSQQFSLHGGNEGHISRFCRLVTGGGRNPDNTGGLTGQGGCGHTVSVRGVLTIQRAAVVFPAYSLSADRFSVTARDGQGVAHTVRTVCGDRGFIRADRQLLLYCRGHQNTGTGNIREVATGIPCPAGECDTLTVG
ncbi:hypothetical protein EC3234A_116c00010 [Escherichia coli]|nr:hypothetical protein EC3234A_116c00010 [Escherichia coli]